MGAPIQVVVADDSPFVCRLLVGYLNSEPGVEVVGTAYNGAHAVELVKELRPDAVTLDLEMPGMNGLEALERIMRECPTPVIVISGVSRRAAAYTLRALEAGAVDFVLKFTPGVETDPETLRREILAKVRAGARTQIARVARTRRREEEYDAELAQLLSLERVTGGHVPAVAKARSLLAGGVIVVGASTGGPMALRDLLERLPPDFPAAVLVVQHMPATFTGVLAAQLDRHIALPVREARDGDPLEPGVVLVAPGGHHLLVDADSRARLNRGPEIGGHRPSIDVTMQSVTQLYGSRTVGVLLTGMGRDGCAGLASIRSRGGKTFAQDAASCVVSGMPQRAVELGVVDCVAPPTEIARRLLAGGEVNCHV